MHRQQNRVGAGGTCFHKILQQQVHSSGVRDRPINEEATWQQWWLLELWKIIPWPGNLDNSVLQVGEQC